MALEWRNTLENIDWDELSNLYRIAPLGNKPAADLKTVFTASLFRCFVYDAGRLVGAGRALADGVDCSYIADIAVHPDYQGSGIGKAIVSKLVELSKGHKKIILYTDPSKAKFYKKLGFKRMTAAMAIFANQALALQAGVVTDAE